MLMLGLNETIDQLAVANSVYCFGHVFKRDNGGDETGIRFEVEEQRIQTTSSNKKLNEIFNEI